MIGKFVKVPDELPDTGGGFWIFKSLLASVDVVLSSALSSFFFLCLLGVVVSPLVVLDRLFEVVGIASLDFAASLLELEALRLVARLRLGFCSVVAGEDS